MDKINSGMENKMDNTNYNTENINNNISNSNIDSSYEQLEELFTSSRFMMT